MKIRMMMKIKSCNAMKKSICLLFASTDDLRRRLAVDDISIGLVIAATGRTDGVGR